MGDFVEIFMLKSKINPSNFKKWSIHLETERHKRRNIPMVGIWIINDSGYIEKSLGISTEEYSFDEIVEFCKEIQRFFNIYTFEIDDDIKVKHFFRY